MVKNTVKIFLFAMTLFLAGCAVDETPVYCVNNDDCALSEYCYNDGSLVDENGDPIGECFAAMTCIDGSCDTGYDCIDGYCKPTVYPPQDYDNVTDDYTPTDDHTTPTDDAPAVTDDTPVTTDDTPVVTDDAPVVTDDAPVVTDDGTVATDDGTPSDDDSIMADEEPDTADTTVPDADVDTAIFSASFTSPGDAATTVIKRPDLIITFTHPVDETTLVDSGGCSDPIYAITITPSIDVDQTNSSLSPDGKVLTVKLMQDLADATTYTVEVPDTIQDMSYNYLDQAYTWTFSTDLTKPTAVLTTPSPTTDVAITTPVVITFSEPMDTATVAFGTSFTITGAGGAPTVTGTPDWSAGDTVLTLTPDADLAEGTTYTVTLTNAVADTAGNTMVQKTFTFTTKAHFVTAALTTPATQYNVAIDTTVVVTFSEAVDTTTITNSTFTITPAVAGTGVFSAGDTVYTFTPDAALAENTSYTVALTTGIANPNGDPLDQNYEWTFKTVDAIAPTVVSTDPADAATAVSVTTETITVTFSEKVINVDGTTMTVEKTCDSTAVTGTVTLSVDGLTATFTPDDQFEGETQYTVTLDPAGVLAPIADPSGNLLAGNSGGSYIFSFTTDLGYGFKKVSTGGRHTCGIDLRNNLYCWGYNTSGQLGTGNTTAKNVPTKVGTDEWRDVSCGASFTCGIKTSGTLWCWGYNYYGQLGQGNYTNRSAPVQVGTDAGWLMVSAGHYFVLAIKDTGTDHELWAWGRDSYGELGVNSTNADEPDPLKVTTDTTGTPLSGWKMVSTGAEHACGITGDDSLYCWGYGSNYRLGGTTTTNRTRPYKAVSNAFAEISAGGAHTCGRTLATNAPYCWGYNYYGQVGADNDTSTNLQPTLIVPDTIEATQFDLGAYHSCVIDTAGALYCAGWDNDGQLGLNQTTYSYYAYFEQIAVPAVEWMSVSAGGGWLDTYDQRSHTCAITTDYELYCWGENINGQVGDGTTTSPRRGPVFVKHPDQP